MKIQVCSGKSCKSRFIDYTTKRIEADIEKFSLENISIENCACMGKCSEGPNVIIDGKIENYADPIKISKIVLEKINSRKNNSK